MYKDRILRYAEELVRQELIKQVVKNPAQWTERLLNEFPLIAYVTEDGNVTFGKTPPGTYVAKVNLTAIQFAVHGAYQKYIMNVEIPEYVAKTGGDLEEVWKDPDAAWEKYMHECTGEDFPNHVNVQWLVDTIQNAKLFITDISTKGGVGSD